MQAASSTRPVRDRRRVSPTQHDPGKLADLVYRSGRSQAEIAQRVGISRSLMSDLVRGDRGTRFPVIEAIAQELGVPADELLRSA